MKSLDLFWIYYWQLNLSTPCILPAWFKNTNTNSILQKHNLHFTRETMAYFLLLSSWFSCFISSCLPSSVSCSPYIDDFQAAWPAIRCTALYPDFVQADQVGDQRAPMEIYCIVLLLRANVVDTYNFQCHYSLSISASFTFILENIVLEL